MFRVRLVPEWAKALRTGFDVIVAALISYPRAIILGLLQGVSELFPISSLGHTVILPQLLGWDIHQNDPYFLSFLVATHLATAIVLFLFFWRDWVRILKGIGRSLRDRGIDPADADAKLGWLLVVGTIPAGLLGLLLQDTLRKAFASGQTAAGFLIANGVLLYGAEILRRRAPQTELDDDTRIARQVSFRDSFLVGTVQSLALIPGFSRSGAAMGGGLLVGLSNKDAARFAFLLATPLIGAAALLKLPELFGHTGDGVRGQALVAALCSAVTAFLAVKYLMRYFETKTLTPFAVYCLVAGLAASAYFAF
ncbi:MAG TPA: undecaprenyl-diphosphate phosphatase [Gaiellaceae bacterium]|nr:undecaprenyl-diphosphate phosphatase [Gaiellaceae bacterium]